MKAKIQVNKDTVTVTGAAPGCKYSSIVLCRSRRGVLWLATLIRQGWDAGKDTESIFAYWRLAQRFA